MKKPIYKLLDAGAWRAAQSAGVFEGSAVDLADGFIHFSATDQLEETARRHFTGVADLICLEVDAEGLADLRWEASRGGALFPHLYSPLRIDQISVWWPAPLNAERVPDVWAGKG